jgi:hypothetical protein
MGCKKEWLGCGSLSRLSLSLYCAFLISVVSRSELIRSCDFSAETRSFIRVRSDVNVRALNRSSSKVVVASDKKLCSVQK